MTKTDAEWQKILSDSEYTVLRKEGTERAFTNNLNDEKREGNYYCKGCNAKLFSSKMKFDSGTGWPSFFDTYPETIYQQLYDHENLHQRKFLHILLPHCYDL